MPAYVLTAGKAISPHLQPSQTGATQLSVGGEGLMSGTAAKAEDIASEFEQVLEAPVFDETGLHGMYDYFASSKLSGVEAALDMAKQLGLTLSKTERAVEILVVTLASSGPKITSCASPRPLRR